MIYVLQVRTGMESETVSFIDTLVDHETYRDVYFPTRVMRKKFHGHWQEVQEKLLPGYIFIDTDNIKDMSLALKKVPRLTKALGRDEDNEFFGQELSKSDERWLRQVMGGRESQYMDPILRGKVGLTLVEVDEENHVKILEGPMQNMEGNILHYDLHRRFADIEVEFMGQRTIIHLGIVIKGKDTDMRGEDEGEEKPEPEDSKNSYSKRH